MYIITLVVLTDHPLQNPSCLKWVVIFFNGQIGIRYICLCTLGPVTPLPILPANGPDDLYTIQNENPKLQANPFAQSKTLPLLTLLYLIFQIGPMYLAVILGFH